MLDHGYKHTSANHCVYINIFMIMIFIILSLYVDDMLAFGKDLSKINGLKNELRKSFDIAQHILRMKVSHDRKRKKLWLLHELYIERYYIIPYAEL